MAEDLAGKPHNHDVAGNRVPEGQITLLRPMDPPCTCDDTNPDMRPTNAKAAMEHLFSEPMVLMPRPEPHITVVVGSEGKPASVVVHGDVEMEDLAAIEQDIEQCRVLAFPANWGLTVITAPPESEAVEALRTLVALKDGPRDDHYEQAKPAAWEKAREVLYGKGLFAALDGQEDQTRG